MASASHSHAYHVLPAVEMENGSVLGMECDVRMILPVSRCQPVPPSRKRRGARMPKVSERKMARKIRSRHEGIAQLSQAGDRRTTLSASRLRAMEDKGSAMKRPTVGSWYLRRCAAREPECSRS